MSRSQVWTFGFLVASLVVHGATAAAAVDASDPTGDPRLDLPTPRELIEAMPADPTGRAGDGHEEEPSATGDAPEAPAPPSEAQEAHDSIHEEAASRLAALLATVHETLDDVHAKVDGLQYDVESTASEIEGDLADALAEEAHEEEAAGEGPYAPASTGAAQELSVEAAILVAATTTAASIALLWIVGSSGMAAGGAGGAGAGSGAGAADALRRGAMFSPLFTRFERESVMKHPNRLQLYTLVSTTPGIRLQDLCDETGLSRTAVTHHLRLLEQQHLLVSRRVGRSRHYYENGGRYERGQKDAYALLQNERSREIADYIRSHPGSIQKQLCEALGLRASIAHWHVKRLEEAELVDAMRQGRTVRYFPADGMMGLRF